MTKTPENGMTWAKLAIKLGVSVVALRQWRELPEAPEVPDVDRWKAFVEMSGLGVVGNRVGAGREELLKENLVKKNRLLDLEIAAKEKKVVDRAEVDALLLHISTLAKTTLYPALERELPPKAEGRTAAEISLLGRQLADRICDQMSRDIEVWAEA